MQEGGALQKVPSEVFCPRDTCVLQAPTRMGSTSEGTRIVATSSGGVFGTVGIPAPPKRET